MEKTATTKRPLARVSLRDSATIFSHIKNKSTKKAKEFLSRLLEKKKSIGGKYYTFASEQILELIKDAESNAQVKGLNAEKLFIKDTTANKSFRFYLPKSRFSHRGKKAKICQLGITLEER